MIKYIILLLNFLGVLLYNTFFVENVTITQNVPSTVAPGSEFTVELIINKGTVGGFAKLQQDLPAGFSASVIDAGNASFTFSNKAVKFIWTELPNEPGFKVSYKVKLDPSIVGEKTLEGKFSFIEDNVKKAIDVTPVKINIGTSESVAAAPAGDTTPAEIIATSPPPAEVVARVADTVPVTARRIIPAEAEKEFRVEVIVKKGNLAGFGKIQENLPEGVTAVADQTQKGSFTFSENKVKIVWVSLPFSDELKISYKVIANNIRGDISIDGSFSYIESDQTKKYNIPSSTITIKEPVKVEPVAIAEPVRETKASVANLKEETPVVKKEAKKPAKSIPAPEKGVSYRIQIAALNQPKKASWFQKKYNISNDIKTELAEGFTKYTTGSFTEYKSARDHRELIKIAGVRGPFVTAYNNGKRITVQEALMITSQQWYK